MGALDFKVPSGHLNAYGRQITVYMGLEIWRGTGQKGTSVVLSASLLAVMNHGNEWQTPVGSREWGEDPEQQRAGRNPRKAWHHASQGTRVSQQGKSGQKNRMLPRDYADKDWEYLLVVGQLHCGAIQGSGL